MDRYLCESEKWVNMEVSTGSISWLLLWWWWILGFHNKESRGSLDHL